jgi:AcrR family transcriptional regulator
MRADAETNRRRLLDVAEHLFAQRGSDVTVAEIVAVAGVGPPTLYRHFGTKDGLIRAVEERRSEAAVAQLARALGQPTGWDGLRVAIEGSLDLARGNQAVRDQRGLALAPTLERLLLSGWSELIERGQKEGSIRADFGATDVPYLFVAIAAVGRAIRYKQPLQDRYVALLMEGRRPDVRGPLPGQPPSAREVHESFSPDSPRSR